MAQSALDELETDCGLVYILLTPLIVGLATHQPEDPTSALVLPPSVCATSVDEPLCV